MLYVTGLVSIPIDHQLKITPYKEGAFLEFDCCTQDPMYPERIHRYKANIWVPNRDIDSYKQKIQYRNKFLVSGKWSAEERELETKRVVFHMIRLKELNQLETSEWYKKKEDNNEPVR